MPETSRRDFLKLVGVSAGAAAAAGCSDHVEKLIPYVVQPEGLTPGNPVVYASTCQECPVGCGLHVKTRENRPIKLEGNPDHPINQGKLCAKAQASVTRTYLPDRFLTPQRRGSAGLETTTWDEATSVVAKAIEAAGGKTHILGGNTGDTLSGLIDRFASATGAKRTIYDPAVSETLREATQRVFGVASEPIFDLSGADLIIDFGAEMLDTGPSPVEHSRQWSTARDVAAHNDGGARLVYVGPRLSVTASSADEWLPAKPGSEGLIAAALAGGDIAKAAAASDIPADTLRRLASALKKAKSAVALPPGAALASRRAVATAAAVLKLNVALGAIGRSVTIPPASDTAKARSSFANALALVAAMDAGEVDVLLIHDANPVYSLPAGAGFETALAKVGMVVSFATSKNETTEQSHFVLPDHAPLESWGDARPRPGIRSLIQPTLRPLHDTQALGDSLLSIGRAIGGDVAARLPTGSFRSVLEAAWAGAGFRQALKDGGVYTATPSAATGEGVGGELELAELTLSGSGEFTLLAFPHGLLSDGRGAALPVLQEIPDPITSVAWESWAEISLASAEKLGVEFGDVLEIETSAGRIEVAVYPRGGIRDDVVAVPTGQGHTVGWFASKEGQGMPGMARGVNVSDLLPAQVDEGGGRAWLTEKATVKATGRHRRLVALQTQDNKRQRKLGEAITLAALGDAGHGEPAAAEHGGGHDGPHEILVPFDPADDAADEQLQRAFPNELSVKVSDYRWGMTVDLDKCTGCSACIAACYVENNLPVVGEEESRKARQMAWMRLDRFVGEGFQELIRGRSFMGPNHEKLGDTDIRNSPMFCQQCGSAPCESVCPVYATYHNEEGLNAMIYNRCIGTRYCANNCPYKVRRYNYWDNQITKWPGQMDLGLNPDVTVRGQGVMEKCTFCVQRIQFARQESKSAGEATIQDGAIQTACQQTCPSGAIEFGNLRDDESAVSKKADDPKRGYAAMHVLNTRPAVTYLAKVTRGKVEG
ncbi:MAG: 4Fe-4S dicluster domain-containing protein [Deltaproteobacteria bacterium]|nr:4Fe-4S dicluster domain-containing protein [Deltaproteobacteria bacterium]MBW2393392.1 4Fe-4S dicluster domain-containing protein [Deltaproteobacteria bacterium]